MRLVIDLIDISPAGVEIKADEIFRTTTIYMYKALTLLRDAWTKVSTVTVADSSRQGGFIRLSAGGSQASEHVDDGTEPPD